MQNNNIINEHVDTPENIAKIIFSNEPCKPLTHQIITCDDVNDYFSVFEILLTILLEGLENLTGGLDTIDLMQFSTNHLTHLNPWFHSFGFNINVNKENIDELHNNNNYYCKILIKTLGTRPIFINRNIQKNFHFLINPLYNNSNINQLSDIFGLFINNNDIYKISFDFFKL